MKGALIILAATVLIGLLLYLQDRRRLRKEKLEAPLPSPASEEGATRVDTESEECCGMHAVCEKTSLSPLGTEAEYYDDEELDRFRGRDPRSYTPEESEEFREVLMTLLPSDVAGWSRSLQIREISLPEDVREELLLIVRELRDEAASR